MEISKGTWLNFKNYFLELEVGNILEQKRRHCGIQVLACVNKEVKVNGRKRNANRKLKSSDTL